LPDALKEFETGLGNFYPQVHLDFHDAAYSNSNKLLILR